VNVIGQDTDRYRFKRAAALNRSKDTSQMINLRHQQVARSLGKNDREEKYTPFDLGSDVSGHDGSS
jgi:hypothetical protein